jgi:hypothetical protein
MYDVGMGPVEMLDVLGLPEDLIERVRTMLAGSADDLESGKPKPISTSLFGGSEAGGQLGHHSSVAQQHVADAVNQMAAGLRGYRDNLSGFVDDMGDTDVSNAVALNTIAQSTACVAAPSFETNNSCTLPTTTTEGS